MREFDGAEAKLAVRFFQADKMPPIKAANNIRLYFMMNDSRF
jgi:hypothetical protein